jgi:hypothetical protein
MAFLLYGIFQYGRNFANLLEKHFFNLLRNDYQNQQVEKTSTHG